jgi:hypothetical protein
MKKIINICDFYKKPVTLPIQSKSKYSTTLGFITTILTFMIFSLHFYLECYEVFYRTNPTVFSNKNNIHISHKSTLKISNETLKFFININTTTFKEDLMDYFYIDAYYFTTTVGKEIKIKFENCTSKELANFLNVDGFKIPEGFNLCPNINISEDFSFPLGRLEKFSFYFSLNQCFDESLGCKQDKDFYDDLKNQTNSLSTMMYFINSQENMLNDKNPFTLNLFSYGFGGINATINIDLEGSEIITQSLFGFFELYRNSGFKVSNYKSITPTPNRFIAYQFLFDSANFTFYYRNYKTFNNAFANAFSLFKLYTWVFSFLLSSYYSYNINTVIINKNFDYGKSLVSFGDTSGIIKDRLNLNEIISEQKKLQSLSQCNTVEKKLTISVVFKKVACCRVLTCKRKNGTRSYYNYSMGVVKKYLSIEQIFWNLVENLRVKQFVIKNNLLSELESNDKLVLDCCGAGDNAKQCCNYEKFEDKLVVGENNFKT